MKDASGLNGAARQGSPLGHPRVPASASRWALSGVGTAEGDPVRRSSTPSTPPAIRPTLSVRPGRASGMDREAEALPEQPGLQEGASTSAPAAGRFGAALPNNWRVPRTDAEASRGTTGLRFKDAVRRDGLQQTSEAARDGMRSDRRHRPVRSASRQSVSHERLQADTAKLPASSDRDSSRESQRTTSGHPLAKKNGLRIPFSVGSCENFCACIEWGASQSRPHGPDKLNRAKRAAVPQVRVRVLVEAPTVSPLTP